jgi:hypothetical protein
VSTIRLSEVQGRMLRKNLRLYYELTCGRGAADANRRDVSYNLVRDRFIHDSASIDLSHGLTTESLGSGLILLDNVGSTSEIKPSCER